MRPGFFRLLLSASVLLASCGAISLALVPGTASAETLTPLPAEFTVKPGETVTKEYSDPKIGSAEVRPNPVDCRDNPAVALTCGAHRIKLVGRTPGFFLRISTSWLSRDAAGNSLPDVDTYLFDGDSSQFDYEQVGGVSGAMPEQIKLIDPEQDEYDVVIGAYAGPVLGYTVSVEYTDAPSAPTAGVPAEFLVKADSPTVTRTFTSALAVPTIAGQPPDSCRNDPSQDLVCDAYRIKLQRNTTKGAQNFVVITLDWNAVLTPDISTPAAGLGGEQVPNLDMYVFDTASHILEGTGGNLFLMPERAGFVATQDEYDLVIQTKRGPSTGYTISAFMTDELFDKPFEILDPVTGQPVFPNAPDEPSLGRFDPGPDNPADVPSLDLAPIDVDEQIAGIGLGTTEQFDAAERIVLDGTVRKTAAAAKAPSGWMLVGTLALAPMGILGAAVGIVRRRRDLLF